MSSAPPTDPERVLASMAEQGGGDQSGDRTVGPLATAALVVGLALAVGLRFAATSPLWLDEALTVNIARLPLPEMFDALRRDGAPPLYYLLLHGWTALFGTGDVAVRSLSAVFAVGAIPAAWIAGAQLGGRRVGVAAVVLLSSSPFAIRYATEARMYSLAMLLVLVGYVLLRRSLATPTGGGAVGFVGVATVTGLLALTHYWSFYLIAAVVVALGLRWRRRGDGAALRGVGAISAGAVLFLPWLGSFVYQVRHTGTPWGRPAGPIDAAITTLTDFGGGRPAEARTLGILLALLAAVALTARPSAPWRLDVDLRTRPGVRTEAAVGAATLSVGILVGWATGSAYASRYTAVLFPLVVLTAAWGADRLGNRRLVAGVLTLAAVLGVAGGARNAVTDRTQAAEVAAAINAGARSGDVVVYCPDQLGPAVHRLVDVDVRQLAFPTGRSPEIVDWVDYAARNRAADLDVFATDLLSSAPADATIWLVWIPGYRTLGHKCEKLSVALGEGRPGGKIVLLHDRNLFENHNLTRLPAQAS